MALLAVLETPQEGLEFAHEALELSITLGKPGCWAALSSPGS